MAFTTRCYVSRERHECDVTLIHLQLRLLSPSGFEYEPNIEIDQHVLHPERSSPFAQFS